MPDDWQARAQQGRNQHESTASIRSLLPSGDGFHQKTAFIRRLLPSGDCFHWETASIRRLFHQDRFHRAAGSIKTGSIRRLVPSGDCFHWELLPSRQVPSVRVLPRQVLSGPSINTVPLGKPPSRQFHASGEDPSRRVPSVGVLSIQVLSGEAPPVHLYKFHHNKRQSQPRLYL